MPPAGTILDVFACPSAEARSGNGQPGWVVWVGSSRGEKGGYSGSVQLKRGVQQLGPFIVLGVCVQMEDSISKLRFTWFGLLRRICHAVITLGWPSVGSVCHGSISDYELNSVGLGCGCRRVKSATTPKLMPGRTIRTGSTTTSYRISRLMGRRDGWVGLESSAYLVEIT